MLRIATTAVALAALFSVSIAVNAVAKTLTVGANIGNVPWEFQNEQSQYVGFEIDLVKKVANQLGYDKTDIQDIPFTGLFSAVESGRIDIAISSITAKGRFLRAAILRQ